jgi:hypothetical protein
MPGIGPRRLNKVELHFDSEGLTVAIALQGLFTMAAARPVLVLAWPEITALSATNTRPGPTPTRLTPGRLVRAVVNVLTTRLDLPDQLAIATAGWTMTVGVRVAAAELSRAIQELLASRDGPAPAVTAS